MPRKRILRISDLHFEQLRAHLFPGDGNEAVALILCGRYAGQSSILVSHSIFPIARSNCSVRLPDLVSWPTAVALPAFARAQAEDLTIMKVHSHPGGFRRFSKQDDRSDLELLTSLAGWTNESIEHGSVVMLPSGEMFGRVLSSRGIFEPLNRVTIAGADVRFFDASPTHIKLLDRDGRTAQAFGIGTVSLLKRMTIGVAGCSGTGSWVVEMLARAGVGRLVLVDPDRVEDRNLNRIVASTAADARKSRLKVHVMRRSVRAMGLGTKVETIDEEIASKRAISALAECDVLFGCLDSADGRDLLNRISACFNVPLFDIGVRLDADGKGGVSYVGGAVHFISPGGSSLLSRKVISAEGIAADELRRRDPAEFEQRLKEGYIRGVFVNRPAVSSVNGFHAALAVNEFLARIHPFRLTGNRDVDALYSNISGTYLQTEVFSKSCPIYGSLLGTGDRMPLLGLVNVGK